MIFFSHFWQTEYSRGFDWSQRILLERGSRADKNGASASLSQKARCFDARNGEKSASSPGRLCQENSRIAVFLACLDQIIIRRARAAAYCMLQMRSVRVFLPILARINGGHFYSA